MVRFGCFLVKKKQHGAPHCIFGNMPLRLYLTRSLACCLQILINTSHAWSNTWQTPCVCHVFDTNQFYNARFMLQKNVFLDYNILIYNWWRIVCKNRLMILGFFWIEGDSIFWVLLCSALRIHYAARATRHHFCTLHCGSTMPPGPRGIISVPCTADPLCRQGHAAPFLFLALRIHYAARATRHHFKCVYGGPWTRKWRLGNNELPSLLNRNIFK